MTFWHFSQNFPKFLSILTFWHNLAFLTFSRKFKWKWVWSRPKAKPEGFKRKRNRTIRPSGAPDRVKIAIGASHTRPHARAFKATERSEVLTSRGAKRRVRYEKEKQTEPWGCTFGASVRYMHPSGACIRTRRVRFNEPGSEADRALRKRKSNAWGCTEGASV